MELAPEIKARERFVKYRGLKSFRSSPWDANEQLPREYSMIFKPGDFNQLQKQVLKRGVEQERRWLKAEHASVCSLIRHRHVTTGSRQSRQVSAY